MARICEIMGKRTQSGNRVSHANNKTKRTFKINLQFKKIYLPQRDIFVHMRLSTHAMRIINKKGLVVTLREALDRGTLSPKLKTLVSSL